MQAYAPGPSPASAAEIRPAQDRTSAAVPEGKIGAGGIMSAMSAAGAAAAAEATGGPVVAVAVSKMVALQQIEAGDEIHCDSEVVRLGTASLTLAIEAWAMRREGGERRKVTAAQFTYIAVDADGRPRPVLIP